ncbi:MAG: hypothetical protein HQK54_08460 [Oligoflexales bacterium]|nr:hypothetical protein [Oligoflexales bacterium]
MNEKSSEIKKKIAANWDLMKVRYPMVINTGAVGNDEVKKEFLGYIDGLRSADEIRQYFVLDASDAHLIFTDLLNLGAVRFLEDSERLPYLRQHQTELKKKIAFLEAERSRLSGENFYLTGQSREIIKLSEHYKDEIPKLKATTSEISGKIGTLKANSEKLWQSNAELFGLAKEMEIKEKKIRTALERLDEDIPRLVKKKTKIASRMNEFDEKLFSSRVAVSKTEKTLEFYRDVIDDVSDHLEDAKLRIDHLIRDR